MNEKALLTYMVRMNELDELVQFFSDYVDSHGDTLPQDVNWSHVGSLGHVVDALRQAKLAITGEDE